MRERMLKILDHIIGQEGFSGIKGYRGAGNDHFELITHYTECGQRTWLRYEPTTDMKFLRLEIRHRFGSLNLNFDPNTAANKLITLFNRNVGAFQATGSYLAVEYGDNDKFYTTLNSFHYFLLKWNDEDIAEALSLYFFDLTMGLITVETSLTILETFE